MKMCNYSGDRLGEVGTEYMCRLHLLTAPHGGGDVVTRQPVEHLGDLTRIQISAIVGFLGAFELEHNSKTF